MLITDLWTPMRNRKSVGSESTFARDLMVYADLVTGLQPAIDAVWEQMPPRAGIAGRTVTLKAKYSNFRQVTRSRTCAMPIADRTSLERIGLDLLSTLLPLRRGVRSARPVTVQPHAEATQARAAAVPPIVSRDAYPSR